MSGGGLITHANQLSIKDHYLRPAGYAVERVGEFLLCLSTVGVGVRGRFRFRAVRRREEEGEDHVRELHEKIHCTSPHMLPNNGNYTIECRRPRCVRQCNIIRASTWSPSSRRRIKRDQRVPFPRGPGTKVQTRQGLLRKGQYLRRGRLRSTRQRRVLFRRMSKVRRQPILPTQRPSTVRVPLLRTDRRAIVFTSARSRP